MFLPHQLVSKTSNSHRSLLFQLWHSRFLKLILKKRGRLSRLKFSINLTIFWRKEVPVRRLQQWCNNIKWKCGRWKNYGLFLSNHWPIGLIAKLQIRPQLMWLSMRQLHLRLTKLKDRSTYRLKLNGIGWWLQPISSLLRELVLNSNRCHQKTQPHWGSRATRMRQIKAPPSLWILRPRKLIGSSLLRQLPWFNKPCSSIWNPWTLKLRVV